MVVCGGNVDRKKISILRDKYKQRDISTDKEKNVGRNCNEVRRSFGFW
jgi:hypothetical protein